ncbi:class I SAM-dependent methyltransferase [Streptomyces prunicolor]|uniref:class I SAM-dependent methyltransferase n=1 Tax=Streptomyces prunicolor TaxID=67348 RepID=UPI0037CF6CF7
MKPLEDLAVYDDADFYDQEFTARTHDIPFFLDQAVRAGGPVLEVACGTGRITLPIARASVEVTGLDLMPSMLARARQRAEDERLPVEWLERYCRDIRSDRRFALLFSATNAMQHLHDLDSVVAFLSMRCFFPEELLALCRLAGLDVAQRYGDYDQSPFTSASPKQLLFCHSQPPTARSTIRRRYRSRIRTSPAPHSGPVDPMGAPSGDGLSPKRPDLLPYEGPAA